MKHDGKGGNWKHPRYTADELAMIDACFGVLPLNKLARRLGRAPHAVAGAAKRHGLGRQRAYTVHEIAGLLGANDYTVKRWVKAGVLPASRHQATAGQMHRTWIARGDFLDFLGDYRFLYDAPLIADVELRRYVASLPPSKERWHTPKEAGRLLRASGFTVRGWLRDGDLRGLLIGGRYWIAESAIRAFVRPVTPSLKGKRRGEFKGQTPEREALRARNKTALGRMDRGYRRRNSTGPTEMAAD